MLRNLVVKTLYTSNIWRAMDAFWGTKRLTALPYHRIGDTSDPEFDFFEPNVSATPEMFTHHMAFVAKHFNVISLVDLEAYITDMKPLPPRPLLITFDDGYLDNYENARPILKQYGFPAVIFLMTEGMTKQSRTWWDACAYYFHHTQLTEADLPLVGSRELTTTTNRRNARNDLLEHLKIIPEEQKQAIIRELGELLAVEPPQDGQIFVTWDQVRELVADGIACQPHTVHHPILTRIEQDQIFAEIRDSGNEIAQQTDQAITTFAYPNGAVEDYNQQSLDALRELNYKLAFTLMDGPMRLSKVRQYPLEIQRIYVGQRDTFEMFVLKTMGLPKLIERQYFLDKGSPATDSG